jgi:hypothetical protein
MLDLVVARSEMRTTLGRLVRIYGANADAVRPVELRAVREAVAVS